MNIELNKQVAALLGWTDFKVVELTHTTGSQLQGIDPKYNSVRPVPDYSGKIEDAWKLFEMFKVIERPSGISLDGKTVRAYELKVYFSESDKAWMAEFEYAYYDKIYESTGKTAPEAICRAVLEANRKL